MRPLASIYFATAKPLARGAAVRGAAGHMLNVKERVLSDISVRAVQTDARGSRFAVLAAHFHTNIDESICTKVTKKRGKEKHGPVSQHEK